MYNDDDYEYPDVDDYNDILWLTFYYELKHTYVNLYNCITIILGLNLCPWSLKKTNPHKINFYADIFEKISSPKVHPERLILKVVSMTMSDATLQIFFSKLYIIQKYF